MKIKLFTGVLLLWVWGTTTPVKAQACDTTATTFSIKPLIVPTTLGISGLLVQGKISQHLQEKVVGRYPGGIYTRVDDYLPYAPIVFSLGLSAAGVEGKHPLGEQVLLAFISTVAAQGFTQSLKLIAKYPRPDGAGNDAFPSGHTTQAFTSATLLHKEYGARSIWYSVGGYGIATTTGALRMLNNRHWLSDVLFGAGVGIGATQVVYWGYPWVKQKLDRKRRLGKLP